MSGRNYYCLCDDNCRFPTMTAEQITAAIAQAVETGVIVDPDAPFITRVKEQNAGAYVTFWVGTQAQYNALETKEDTCIYVITDDTKQQDIDNALDEMQAAVQEAAANANAAAQAAAAAAPKSHNHSAANITSGTLSAARGGTGHDFSKIPANALIRNSGDNTQLWYTATANGALYATAANGAVKFGVLPIAQGGIGSSNGATGLKSLFAAGNTILSTYQYGTSLPSTATKGRLFLKKV